jgi:hypothetical protein
MQAPNVFVHPLTRLSYLQLKVEMRLKLSLSALHARRGTGSQTSHFLGLTLQVRLVYKDLS